MPEELALEQRLRKGCRIHGAKDAIGTAGQAVDRTPDELLADPGLPCDQDRAVGVRDLFHELEQVLHRLRASDDPDQGAQVVLLRGDRCMTLDRRSLILRETLFDDGDEIRVVDGLA